MSDSIISLEDFFPAEMIPDIQNKADLQGKIMNMDCSSYESVCNLIKSSNFLQSQDSSQFLINCGLLMAQFRPKTMKYGVSLLKMLDISQINLVPIPVDNWNKWTLAFIHECLEQSLFRDEEILIWLHEFAKINIMQTSRIFFLFAPFLAEKDPEFYNYVEEKAKRKMKIYYNENIEQLKANDWEIQRNLARNIYKSDSINSFIVNDDFEKLLENEFDLNQAVAPSTFDFFNCISVAPKNLIELAAFHGSKSIFRHLIDQGTKITQNLSNCICAGGNIEIIELAELKGIDLSKSIHLTVQFHRNEAASWFYERKNPVLITTDQTSIFHRAFMANNLEVILFCLKSRCDLNAKDWRGWSPIYETVYYGSVDSFKLLMIHKKLEFDKQALVSFLFEAAKHGYLEIMKILIDVDASIINEKKEEITILHYSVSIFHYEIVKYLLSVSTIDLTITNDVFYIFS